tara:strand:+ start:153 stop:776 length:624 start_codon:yes stop_codon:yes gene_type:complete
MTKRISISKVVAALSITIIIFSSGFILGNFLTSGKIELLQQLQNDIYTESIGLDVLFTLAAEDLCDEDSIILLNKQLNDLGDRLTYFEARPELSEESEVVANQYNALEIKHFLLINDVNEQCNNKYTTILFFFGGEEECQSCALQGGALTAFKSEHPETMIYSFNWNSEFPPVLHLVQKYGVSAVPTLVINGQKVEGYTNLDRLNEI